MAMGIPANLVSRASLSAPGAAIARGAFALPSATAPPLAIGSAIAHYVQPGLPGLGGALVPYLTQ
jgi:hypothetical protein